jgi:Protein of unknown function (DUF1236)
VVNDGDAIMKMTFLAIAAAGISTLPLTAHAQSAVVDPWAPGSYDQWVPGLYDAPETVVGVEDWPRFREYVVREGVPAYHIGEDVRVGYVLPRRGVALYDLPRTYGVRPGYRYAVVNDVPVIVEPRSRRIVEVID